MTTVDPITNEPLPDSAIQRVLFVAPRVHVYQIPPLTSTKGHNAGSWTHPTQPTAQQIFTARLRVLEISIPSGNDGSESVSTTVLLEDPSNGQLFAAAPYASPAAVEQAVDSSRFFAMRVVGDGGKRKATLGIGFEERSEAFDFSIALQDARRVLGWEKVPEQPGRSRTWKSDPTEQPEKRDFRLKEGEVITVDIGNRGKSRRSDREDIGGNVASGSGSAEAGAQDDSNALFSIKGPPGDRGGSKAGSLPILQPPPTASEVKAERRRSRQAPPERAPPSPSAEELGFDDGEFGEFQ